MHYDVAIIGGGIAGLSTALHICTKADATLLIVDKDEIGNPTKTSPFTFPDVVERFGLGKAVLQKYTRFTYKSPTGISASFEYDNPAFVTLDYKKACAIMLDRILKEGNAEVLEKTEALDFESNKNFLRTKNLKLILSNSLNVTVNLLVDASGKSFFTARKLGLDMPRLYSHAYGELLTECMIEDAEEVCIFAGRRYGNGGGWFYPINGKTARLGFATVTNSLVYPLAIVRQNFKDAYINFYPYSEMIAGSKTVRPEFGTIPIGPLKRFVFDRILIVGDAAGQATPWYCEGIRPALESGEICGRVIAEAYKQRKYSKRILEKHQKLWDTKNRKMYSKTAKIGHKSWFRSQEEWDTAVKHVASLTPEEMIQRIRYSKF